MSTRYIIWCQTEKNWIEKWSDTPLIVCPTDPGHTVTPSSVIRDSEDLNQTKIYFNQDGIDEVWFGLSNENSTNIRLEGGNLGIGITPTEALEVGGNIGITGTYKINGVDIVIPSGGTTGQILEKIDGTNYNTQWGDGNTISNIGITGADIFFQKTSQDFELRGLLAGTNIELIQDSQNITINSTANANNVGAVAKIYDKKTVGTDGGTFLKNVWRERDLNTLEQTGTFVSSLSGNEFTLDAGTYTINAPIPAHHVEFHKARLYNVSDSSVVMYGTSCRNKDNDFGNSIIIGFFTIASSKTFRIEHRSSADEAVNGFGTALGFGDEIYSQVFLTKIS